MTQTILDILADLGASTTDPLWLPVLAWTVLAFPLWVLLERTDRLHPNAEYRLSQVLLAVLPVGIVAVSLVEMLPDAARSTMLPVQSVVVLPSIETSSVSAPVASWAWMHAVGLLTVAALGIGLFRLGRFVLEVVAVGRIRRQVETATTTALQDEINRLREQLNVRRPVQVCFSSDAAVPMTLGGLRATILVPKRLAEATEELRMTLRHELVHIRRWDDCAQLAERFVAALFAAHPLVSRLRRQSAARIAAARERACDAAVLNDGETPAGDYARLLTTFADGASPRRLGALSLSESPSSLTDRLSAMRSSMPSVLSSRFALGTALVVVSLGLTLGVVACSDTTGPSFPGDAEEPDAASVPYKNVDDPPELVGGMTAFQESITYPEMAKEAGIEGRVIVQFVVDKDGNVTNPELVREDHTLLNDAALTAVKEQTFEPGLEEGELVPVQMSLPVTFRLDGESDGSTGDAATSETDPHGRLFEKAGIQVVRVLMNEEGDLLLDGEPVEVSNLTDAVRQRLTEDAARAALLYADGAPTDRVAAAEARLRALDLQKVQVRRVE